MKIRVYNARGREVFLSEGQTAPAGWFKDGQPPVELEREHRVTVFIFQGEDLDMDEDDPRNVRRVAELVPVWTPEEIAAQAKAEADRINAENAALHAAQAAHESLVAECATKNATATGGVWEIISVQVALTDADRAAKNYYRFEDRVVFTAAKPAETTATEGREVGSGYGRHSRHGGLEALGDKPYNKADVDWAFDARNPSNAWND